MSGTLMLFADGEPAAGAAISDVIVASLVGLAMLVAFVAFGYAHRSGRTGLLTKLGGFSERVSGLPAWAALPAAVAGGSLLIAVFGFYADVASHIDDGRDPGPFANPFHYFIIFGLLGIALAGALSILIGTSDEGNSEENSAVRIGKGGRAPVGGILMLICGSIAVAGFPLDDVWHRIFGQDVTLWSPTHLQMVGGAALSTLALMVLMTEGYRSPTANPSKGIRFTEPVLIGAFLVGLSAFQAEFDYSVPQFRLLFHPVLLMLCAGAALVPARIRLGAGGALKAVLTFIVIRGTLSLAIGPGLGHTMPHFPLYLAEALAIEAVARFVSTERQLTFGAIAGVAIGTFGLAGEWIWSHLWMTMPWTSALVPEGIVFGFIAAVAGGVLGGYIARALTEPSSPRQVGSFALAAATTLAILACMSIPLPRSADVNASASMELTPVDGRPGWVDARIALDPATTAEGAEWFNVTAWQGGGSVISEPIETAPGVYTTSDPIPVNGEWKSLIRLQRDSSVMALPIYMPKDAVIGASEVPAEPSFTRRFGSDQKLLLREAKEVSSVLTYGASSALTAIAILWVLTLGWGLRRLDRVGYQPSASSTSRVTSRSRASSLTTR
ncbi:MAG: hypothetical protein QOG54_1622 [Actinomycetota bacterium]|jgi:hypothetical protein|nr:hypothetical protein [Actinomycetota bacterium]